MFMEIPSDLLNPNHKFVDAAVSVDPPGNVNPCNVNGREFKFSLVMGSSGSGKTMFSYDKLPQLVTMGNKGTFTVLAKFSSHFQVNWDPLRTEGEEKRKLIEEAKNEMVCSVRSEVNSYLKKSGHQTLGEKEVIGDAVRLTVVYDESGSASNMPFLATSTP